MYNLPFDVLTSKKLSVRRLQVDVANTGFFDNRESRYFREFRVPSGQSWWIKVVVPADGIILRNQTLRIDDGRIRFRAWRDLTINANFVQPSTPVDPHTDLTTLCSGHFRQNNLPSAPDHTRLTEITESEAEVSVSGGVCSEVQRLRTSGSTAQAISVGLTTDDERGIGPDTYYLELQNLGSGDAVGEYILKYEERLGQG